MSRTKRIIGKVLGLENENGEAVIDGTPAVTITAGDTVIEVEPLSTEGTEGEATVEVVEAEAEINEVADGVEEMQENVEALESMAIALRADIAAGGMSPQAAQYFNAAHAAIAGRHLDMSKRVLATESFASASTRLQMTQAAHESVMETIKKFIKAIIEFVKKQIDKVVEFFKSIFGAKARFKRRLESLEKAVAKQGSKVKEDKEKIKVPSILASDDGKAPAVADLLGHAKEISEADDAVGKMMLKEKKAVSEVLAPVEKGGEITVIVVLSVIKSAMGRSGHTGIAFDQSALGQNQFGEGTHKLGHKVIVDVGPSAAAVEGLSIQTAMGLAGLKLIDAKKDLKIEEDMEIAPLNSGDNMQILKALMGFATASEGSDTKEFKEVSKTVDGHLKKLESAAAKLGKADDKENAAAIRGAASGLSGILSGMGRSIVQIQGECMRGAQALANLVAASVASYE